MSVLSFATLARVHRLQPAGQLRRRLFNAVPIQSMLQEQFRQALARGQVQAYFQPKCCLHTGAVSSVEVLVRWCHPVDGVLSPDTFVPQAAGFDLTDALLFMQVAQGVDVLLQARRQGNPIKLAFNVQARQLLNEQILLRLEGIFKAHDVPGEAVMFEVTETGALEVVEQCQAVCRLLRSIGCSLSIDDYGSGYSSLHRLCQLPFNEIKLDGEFVRLMGNDPKGEAIIRSTQSLADALGIDVVVEGVDTQAQRQALLKMGCRLGQGYLCAPALSAADLFEWLETRLVEPKKVVEANRQGPSNIPGKGSRKSQPKG